MSWADLAEWWVEEVNGDPAYEDVVTPMFIEALGPQPGALYLDLGAGEGRLMAELALLGSRVHGVDINLDLAGLALSRGPAVIGELPDLSFLRSDSYDGAYCVLVLEHVEDHRTFFESAARVVRPGGVLALVMNHPAWTAPRSTPITDGGGEVLWRSGDYFSSGRSLERAGDATVVFHHRTMGELLTSAAGAGWSLEALVEAPHHELPDQHGIPRLLACRWRLLP